MTEASMPTTPKRRLVHLDFARAVAIFAVLVIHFTAHYNGLVVPLFGGTANLTMLSSPLFFAVSGASLACSTPRERVMNITSYIKKRLLRIFPVFYLAYLAAFGIQMFVLREGLPKVPAWHIVFSLIGFDGLLAALGIPTFYLVGEWFLGCIIGVYVLFPLFHSIWRRWRWVLVVICVLATVATLAGVSHSWSFYLCMPIAAFTFGMLTFSSKPSWIGALCGLVAIASLWVVAPPLSPDFLNIVYGCSCAYVLFFVGRLLNYVPLLGEGLAWFGGVSFAVILTHHFVFYHMLIAFNPANSGRMTVLCYIAGLCGLVMILSVLLHRLEDALLAWMKRIPTRWRLDIQSIRTSIPTDL